MRPRTRKWMIVKWIPIVLRRPPQAIPPSPRAIPRLPVIPVIHAVGLPGVPMLIDHAGK
jgi:hypothetical protein